MPMRSIMRGRPRSVASPPAVPDPLPPLGTCVDIHAQSLALGNDPRAVIVVFFKQRKPAFDSGWRWAQRVEIDRIALDGVTFIGGRLWPDLS